MELKAIPTTIDELFSIKKKYVVPRFQREYQWTTDKVRDLWDDVSSCITTAKKSKQPSPTEYFIGPLVLIGKDTSTSYQIVDGQQRLTTITLLLRAIVDAYEKIGQTESASALYGNYLEGRDDDGKPFFKLENETPRPYFQTAIQFRKPDAEAKPKSEEEKRLKEAFDLCKSFVSAAELGRLFPTVPYTDALSTVRSQILRYVKLVCITVAEEEDAYTIFETLNARGIDLSSADLVRNSLLKQLKSTFPSDVAKTKWNGIKENCVVASVTPDTFLRHYWLSRFGHTTEDRLYKAFKLQQKDVAFPAAKDFLTELSSASNTYRSIAVPVESDWKEKHRKAIYQSLRALSLFRLVQIRPVALAVFGNSQIKDTAKKNILTILEHFHFCYTAVCSLPASGLDRKYGRTARDLRAASKDADVNKCIVSLADELQEKMPTPKVFEAGLQLLGYTKEDDSSKRLIQYFFEKYESQLRASTELVPQDLTLEHISSQKGKIGSYGQIGNLIPLAGALNEEAGTGAISKKILVYQKSSFAVTKDFCKRYSTETSWGTDQIEARTKYLAKHALDKIFKISPTFHTK